MIQITIGLICFATIWLVWKLAVDSYRSEQEELEVYTQSGEVTRNDAKVGWAEAYFIIPVARKLLLWIDKRGRSP